MATQNITLASRAAVAAVDSAAVVGDPVRVPSVTGAMLTFAYTTTGSPATIDVRAAVEMTTDGTNWHQLCRFIDQTTTTGAIRIARFPASAAAAEGALTAVALGSSAASATLSDGALAVLFRAQTKLETLTGGTAPTVTITVSISV